MSDGERIRQAAIDCLLDQCLALLSSPTVVKAELVPELKRRALEFAKIAKQTPKPEEG